MDITVKVNNSTEDRVRIVSKSPIISWDWDEQRIAIPGEYGSLESTTFVDQTSYSLRIGQSSSGWGTDGFDGDMDTIYSSTSNRQYRYRGKHLERGNLYYGQVQIINDLDEVSEWKTFAFQYNNLPFVVGARVLPVNPSPTTQLSLEYTFVDSDMDSEGASYIRWFRDGVHDRQFDNQTVIDSSFLVYGQTWSADILPYDGYEYGSRATTESVSLVTEAPVASSLKIVPESPNENDILRAVYDEIEATTGGTDQIRWYANNVLQEEFNDQEYVRLDIQEGDVVRFELTPYDGVSYGITLASSPVTIVASKFIVDNLTVDGQKQPLSLLTMRPVFSWTTHKPKNREPKFVSIKVGTLAGGDNVFSTVVNTNVSTFQMPSNLLKRGGDYYVSVAVNDSEEFSRYTTSHFRLTGSLWEESVSNSTGWTVEAVFVLSDQDSVYEAQKFQVIRIQDGTRYGEIRIYADRLAFTSIETLESGSVALSGLNVITIAGNGNNLKVYLNRSLIIDATNKFLQDSSSKRLEIGTVGEGALLMNYQSVTYSVTGRYDPTDSNYAAVQFAVFADFEGQEIVGIEGVLREGQNIKIVGVNPHDETKGGAVYEIVAADPLRFPTVNRTFSPINRISNSFDQKWKIFSHARGGSIFFSYLINNWDHETIFDDEDGVFPTLNGWDIVNNTGFVAATQDNDGLLIDTSFAKIGRVNE
jgi:hypothetical protein